MIARNDSSYKIRLEFTKESLSISTINIRLLSERSSKHIEIKNKEIYSS